MQKESQPMLFPEEKLWITVIEPQQAEETLRLLSRHSEGREPAFMLQKLGRRSMLVVKGPSDELREGMSQLGCALEDPECSRSLELLSRSAAEEEDSE